MKKNDSVQDKHLDEMLTNYCNREIPFVFRVKETKEERKNMRIKPILKFAAAGLCIAAVLSAGIFSRDITNILGRTGGGSTDNAKNLSNSFVMSVSAAEITRDKSAKIQACSSVLSFSEDDNYDVQYSMELPINCKGDNVKSITYSVNRGAFSIAWIDNGNIVVEGKENNDYDASPEVIPSGSEEPKDKDPDAVFESVNYKHYSSFTVDYDRQITDNTTIALVGASTSLSGADQKYVKQHREELFNFEGKKSMLTQKECIEKLLGNINISCRIEFNDGTEQTQNIRVGTEIMKPSQAFPELKSEYYGMSEQEISIKDAEDVFITFALA